MFGLVLYTNCTNLETNKLVSQILMYSYVTVLLRY